MPTSEQRGHLGLSSSGGGISPPSAISRAASSISSVCFTSISSKPTCTRNELQWSHDLSAPRSLLQWSHDLSAMDTTLHDRRETAPLQLTAMDAPYTTRHLQWSHDLSAMDTVSSRLADRSCTKTFNGAMTSQPWILGRFGAAEHVRPTSFNGAMTSQPWIRAAARRWKFDLADLPTSKEQKFGSHLISPKSQSTGTKMPSP